MPRTLSILFAKNFGSRPMPRGWDLELLKQLKAAGDRGRNVGDLSIRGSLNRLAKGGYLVAHPIDSNSVHYRITSRGQDAIIEHDM
jgi:hypothetical protein